MSYRTILALVSGQANDQQTLAVSCDLARRFEAEVRVAPSSPDPVETMVGYDLFGAGFLSAGLGAELQEARATILAYIEKAARKAAEDAEIMFGEPKALQASAHLVPAAVNPWLTLLNEAPFGDLAVIARDAADDGAVLSSVFAEVLMNLRLPILLANGSQSAAGGTVVVAWNGSMEAGRAVRAALPLLLQADQVMVVQRERGIEWNQRDAASLKRCLEYLQRHGVAKLESLLIEGMAGDSALMDAVNDAGAGLLVAGAYGHPRWQEFLFSGVTRAFLREKDAPHLLISH
jgi:nucleotide-binding universal stress UspA family protein